MLKLPHTIVLLLLANKIMLKIPQARLQQYVNWELPDVKTGFRKYRGPEMKFLASVGSSKKQENFRKTATTASVTTPKILIVWISTNYGKLFKRWEIPDHLTCLLRNLYAGQEATVEPDMEQQFSSVAQSCPNLCDPVNLSTPSFPVHRQPPQFTQTNVHWIGDAIQPSHPLSSPSLPALNLYQGQVLLKWVSSLHLVAKVLEFQLQHQSFQWTPRTDLL